MRPLEIGLLILIFLSIVEPLLSFRKPRWIAYLSVVPVIVALA